MLTSPVVHVMMTKKWRVLHPLQCDTSLHRAVYTPRAVTLNNVIVIVILDPPCIMEDLNNISVPHFKMK